MIVPIVCYSENCPNRGEAFNEVRGILPPDIDDFFEGYDDSYPEDWCPLCHEFGVAEDPIMEYDWEERYWDGGIPPYLTYESILPVAPPGPPNRVRQVTGP